jgi:hypothetical protein
VDVRRLLDVAHRRRRVLDALELRKHRSQVLTLLPIEPKPFDKR